MRRGVSRRGGGLRSDGNIASVTEDSATKSEATTGRLCKYTIEVFDFLFPGPFRRPSARLRGSASSGIADRHLFSDAPSPDSYANTVQSFQVVLQASTVFKLRLRPQNLDLGEFVVDLDADERTDDPAIMDAMVGRLVGRSCTQADSRCVLAHFLLVKYLN